MFLKQGTLTLKKTTKLILKTSQKTFITKKFTNEFIFLRKKKRIENY